jgi:hypothetical protein
MVNDGFAQPLRMLMKRSRAELGAEIRAACIPDRHAQFTGVGLGCEGRPVSAWASRIFQYVGPLKCDLGISRTMPSNYSLAGYFPAMADFWQPRPEQKPSVRP